MRPKRPPWWPLGDPTCPSPDQWEFARLPWPDSVPFLATADLAIEPSEDDEREWPGRGGGRFTLGDWVMLAFPQSTCAAVVIEAVLGCVGHRLGLSLQYFHLSQMPPGGTLRLLAASWNEVLRVLGYEPVAATDEAACPPATSKKTKRPKKRPERRPERKRGK